MGFIACYNDGKNLVQIAAATNARKAILAICVRLVSSYLLNTMYLSKLIFSRNTVRAASPVRSTLPQRIKWQLVA